MALTAAEVKQIKELVADPLSEKLDEYIVAEKERREDERRRRDEQERQQNDRIRQIETDVADLKSWKAKAAMVAGGAGVAAGVAWNIASAKVKQWMGW
jgi:carbonic anhydrase